MVAKRDNNHKIVVNAMKYRMGGYRSDDNGAHHANLMGLPVSAYDMHKAGNGFPDWIVFVSYFAVLIEVKNPEGRGMRYTPAEVLFKSNFQGVLRTFTDETEVYDYLKQVAQQVMDLEDVMAVSLPESYVRTFFPKVDLFGKSVSISSIK